MLLPMRVAPSRNETVPVGVAAAALLTVAVNVTVWPTLDGLAEEARAIVVETRVTDWVTTAEVLPAKAAFAEYVAVMEWEPTTRSGVVKVAWPAARAPVPMAAAPSKNVTVPVGVPDALLTVAVKVTACPNTDGLSEEITLVLVEIPFTVCVSAAEVLGSNAESPRYEAVMECEPTLSAEVESVADPAFSVAVPSEIVPSKNSTVPVGVPPVPVTLAVKATCCPAVAGFSDELTIVVDSWPFTVWVSADEMLLAKFASPV